MSAYVYGAARNGAKTALAMLMLLALSILAACAPAAGGASPLASATRAPAATADATATSGVFTPPPLPITHIATGICGPYFPSGIALTPARGLLVSQTSSLGNLAYPLAQIPNSQQAQPIAPPVITSSAYRASASPVVNPRLQELGGGYTLAICNASSQAHVVSAVRMTLVDAAPYTGKLAAWDTCSGVYLPGQGFLGAGCGGADPENEYMHAALAADAAVGATVTATQTGTNSSDASDEVNLGPLPVTLHPGQAMTIEIGVTQPSAPGLYTYAFALTVDSGDTGIVAYSPTTLLASVTTAWNGGSCLAPAMQAQLAAMPTPTSSARASVGYICPAS